MMTREPDDDAKGCGQERHHVDIAIDGSAFLAKFGLGGGRWKFRSEQIDVEDIFRGAQVYAMAALEIGNWEKLPG